MKTIRVGLEIDGKSTLVTFQLLGEETEKLDKKFRLLDSAINIGDSAERNLGQPLRQAIGGAIGAAVEFESEIANVNKALGASDSEIATFSKSVIELSRQIPISTTELNAIAEAGAMVGVKFKDMTVFTEKAAKSSVALDIEAGKLSNSMAKLSNVFGFQVTDLDHLSGSINMLSNNMAASAEEILDVTTRSGGMAKQFGLTEHETAALGATMISLGKAPDVAATGINALLGKMSTATIQSKSFQDGLEALGVSAVDLEADVRERGVGALTDFLHKLKDVDDAQRGAVLGQLFGAEYSDDIAALVGGLGQYEKALELVGDKEASLASLQDELDVKLGTTKAQFELLRNNASALGIELGSALLPAVNEFLQILIPAASALADFASAHPQVALVAVALGSVVAVGIPLINAGLSIAAAWSGVTAGFAALSGVLGSASGIFTASVAAMSGAWTGFTGLLAGGLGVVKAIAATIAGAFTITTGLIVGAIAIWVYNINFVIQNFSELKSAVAFYATGAADSVGNMINRIKSWFGNLGYIGKAAGIALLDGFTMGMFSRVSAAVQAISGIVSQVRAYLPSSPAEKGALSDLDKTGTGLVNTFSAGIQRAAPAAIGAADSLTRPISEALSPKGGATNNVNNATATNTNQTNNVQVTYNQVINVSSSGTSTDSIVEAIKNGGRELVDALRFELNRYDRINYQ